MKVTKSYFVAFLSLFALSFFVRAAFAEEPIDTDGPDFVDSSEVIGKGRFQYEADVVAQRDHRRSMAIDTTSTPILLKYGITDAIDMRIQTDGYTRIANDDDHSGLSPQQSGFNDIVLGFKWHSQDAYAWTLRPATSWIFDVDTPSGSTAFKGRGISPSLRSVMTWELPLNLSLGIMPGIKSSVTSDGRRFVSGIFGVVLDRKITEKFRTFIEVSLPQLARSANGGTSAYWDAGGAYLLTADSQLGFRVGLAANQNTPSQYVLLELAQRF